jgi:hypothetical protein
MTNGAMSPYAHAHHPTKAPTIAAITTQWQLIKTNENNQMAAKTASQPQCYGVVNGIKTAVFSNPTSKKMTY